MRVFSAFLLGICLPLILAATAARIFTFADGNILTAAQLNAEFDNIISTLNNLDEENIASGAAILPVNLDASIAGTNITRSGTGVLSAESVPSHELDATPSVAGSTSQGSSKSGIESGSAVEYVVSSLQLETTGNPVLLKLSATEDTDNIPPISCSIIAGEGVTWSYYRDGTVINSYTMFNLEAGARLYFGPVPDFIDTSVAGTYTYEIRALHSDTGTSCSYDLTTMYAWEL